MRRERERDSEENAQASRGERATPRRHIINGARATLNARRLFRGEGPGLGVARATPRPCVSFRIEFNSEMNLKYIISRILSLHYYYLSLSCYISSRRRARDAEVFSSQVLLQENNYQ